MNPIRFKIKKVKQNKGSILALMVLLILLLSLSSMALIGVAREARIRTAKSVSGISARFAADAGVERAIYLMNKDLEAGTWSVDDIPTYTSESLTACNAEYTVTFDGSLASGYQITSVGKSGWSTKTVCATVKLNNPFANDYAILTKGNLGMKSKSTVSGYNSGDPDETNVLVAIGTLSNQNSSVDLKSGVTVEGDVYIGPGGDPDEVVLIKDDDSVEGEIFVMPKTLNLPIITPPNFTAFQGKISGKNVTLTTSDSGKYTEIDISNKGKLEINGDLILYITGDVTLDNEAELKVKKGSTLKLYFDGDFEAKNSSNINNESKVPFKVQLYGTGSSQKIEMKNSSDIQGVVYAPNADMTIYNKVDAYGAFIVDTFEMKNSGDVYYDKALKETSLDDEAVYFTITRWEEF
ncbi:MAG: hypothetical protein ISS71_04580 [Phycisphaerae bacterium]|nr:hypothetical protein [Phycisphaerae bacterium]